MGATGAGKTSIIQLLQRLYDATDGSIYVDDVNIRDMSLKQLRSNISIVMQDVFLFSDTISENVKLGKRNLVDLSTIRGAQAADGEPAVDNKASAEEQHDERQQLGDQ